MRTLLTIAILLLATPALAQTPAKLGGTGTPDIISKEDMATYAVTGNIAKINDANSATDCDPLAATGSSKVVCWYTGSAWVVISSAGGVTGPATTTDEVVALWDSTDGTVLKNSEITTTDEDGDGTKDALGVPGGVSTNDRNAFATPAENKFTVLDNDVDIATNPTCDSANQLKIIDTDESAADTFVVCLGTTNAGELASMENLKVGEAASIPTCNTAATGLLYWDTTGPDLCYCNGTSWAPVDGTGTCA